LTPFLGDGRRLEQDPHLCERRRQREDVLVVLDVVLGEVPVQEVDPALVIDVVGGVVLQTDLPVDRRARPADACDDIGARRDRRRDVRPDLDDPPEALVPGDEVVVAGRCGAVLGGVDLLVRAVDAHAEHLDLHPAPVGDVVDVRLRDLPEVDRVGRSWMYGDGSHTASVSQRRRVLHDQRA
jgi:hypothetical protein